MANISFFLTQKQILNRTKTVTRRVGWKNAFEGLVLQPIVKGQGLGKGGKVDLLGGQIRLINVTSERLDALTRFPEYGAAEVVREGFPDMTPQQFVEMLCKANKGLKPWRLITRLEFEYL